MTLEELIRTLFIQNSEMAGKLTQYAGSPAVFLLSAPSDTQSGWGLKGQYPRITTRVELFADSERKRQGMLIVDLYCDIGDPESDTPEDIAPLIKQILKDVVVMPEDGSPYCFAWQRTEGFQLESKNSDTRNSDKRISGYEVTFDILEYPEQYTTYPDPVESMNIALKNSFPNMFVLGADALTGIRYATEENPIIYVRMDTLTSDHASMALSWINCRMAIHVIAPTASARSKWVRCISNALMISGEVGMTDETPLRFTGVQTVNTSDYLHVGQILLSAQYTLPRLSSNEPATLGSISIGGI